MDLALREARRAFEADEVPVGAVIIDTATGRVVAKAHNQREMLQDTVVAFDHSSTFFDMRLSMEDIAMNVAVSFISIIA